MTILYYDCFMGISGDMNMAALIDLGADKEHLKNELKKLFIDDEFELQITSGIKNGITGTKVDVVLKNHHHHHDNGHSHDDHHHHRHYSHIKKMIEQSGLSTFVKKNSIETFEKIAIAEAKIHGTTIDKVHFHEVGATDSIVDVVGSAICIENLAPDKIISSPLQVGGGFVKCDHGTFPVPAPATTEILKNIPIRSGLVNGETTTPTGAAIIAANADEIVEGFQFTIKKTGYGIGNKDFEVPNVLRVLWGESEESENGKNSFVIEVNIDDMNPELFGFLYEELFEQGASDVYTTSIGMKKNRPATKLSVLCKEHQLKTICHFLLTNTTSFGLRYFPVSKMELERKSEPISIDGIEIKIKYAYLNDQLIKYKPEYDDCVSFAKQKNIPLLKVYKIIEQKIDIEK